MPPTQALDDLIRKGWTVSLYYCGLAIPAAVARRQGEKVRVEAATVDLCLTRLHDAVHEVYRD